MKEILDKILVKEVVGPIVTILFMTFIYEILKRIINKVFTIKTRKIREKKQLTLKKFFINLTKTIITIITTLIILEIYNIKTSAIIASLGAVTVVIGLAFQDILKDFIAGISFIFEDSYSIGDWVTINGFKGEVINIGIKSTRVKAYSGEILIINNGSIKEVINHTASNSMAVVDVGISYNEDINKVEQVLNNLCENILPKEIKSLKGKVTLLGIEELGDSAVNYRITALVEPGMQFEAQRIIRKEIKLEFDKNKIEIPYKQLVIHNE